MLFRSEDVVSHRLVLARVFRTRAVVLMVLADKAVRRRELKDKTLESLKLYRSRIGRGQRKAHLAIERAAAELDRAEAILQTAGRHVRTWSRLFQQRAQVSIEALLLLAIERDFEVGSKHNDLALRNEVVRLVNSGLVAIRGIIDCGEESDIRQKVKAGVRWIQLMIAAYVLLASSASHPPPTKTTSKSAIGNKVSLFFRMNSLLSREEFLNMWVFLNQSAGLGGLVSSEEFWLDKDIPLRKGEPGEHRGAPIGSKASSGERNNYQVVSDVLRRVGENDHRFLGGLPFGQELPEPQWFLREFILQKMIETFPGGAKERS